MSRRTPLLPCLATAVLAAAALLACDDDVINPEPEEVVSVEIIPADTTLTAIDHSASLSADGLNANGEAIEHGAEWSVSPDGVVSLNADVGSHSAGLKALAEGTATITAKMSGRTGSTTVTVEQVATEAEIRAIPGSGIGDPPALPGELLINGIDTVPMMVVAVDDETHELSEVDDATWSTSDPTVAVVEGDGGAVELIGVGEGEVEVVVEIDEAAASRTFRVGRWAVYDEETALLEQEVLYGMALDGQNRAWLVHNGTGVSRFDGREWRFFGAADSGLPSDEANSVAVDPSGAAWFGTSRGLARFDGGDWSVWDRDNSALASNGVHNVTAASDGSVWFSEGDVSTGVLLQSLRRMSNGAPVLVDSAVVDGRLAGFENACADVSGYHVRVDSLRTIAAAPDGDLWLGTSDADYGLPLLRVDGATAPTAGVTSFAPEDGDCHKGIAIDVVVDTGGEVYMWFFHRYGGEYQLVAFDGQNWRFGPSEFAQAAMTLHGESVWVGVSADIDDDLTGLIRFDKATLTEIERFTIADSPLPSHGIRGLAVDGRGVLWIATHAGLARYLIPD